MPGTSQEQSEWERVAGELYGALQGLGRVLDIYVPDLLYMREQYDATRAAGNYRGLKEREERGRAND